MPRRPAVFPASGPWKVSCQVDAIRIRSPDTYAKVVSTDPPYYDNIGYADSIGLLSMSGYAARWGLVFPDFFATR